MNVPREPRDGPSSMLKYHPKPKEMFECSRCLTPMQMPRYLTRGRAADTLFGRLLMCESCEGLINVITRKREV